MCRAVYGLLIIVWLKKLSCGHFQIKAHARQSSARLTPMTRTGIVVFIEELSRPDTDAQERGRGSMSLSQFDNHPIETIRFNERDKRKILDSLIMPQQEDKGSARNMRIVYSAPSMTVSITNPGGNTVTYSVIPRNLSRRGVSFLHGRFIYPDCKCSVILPTLDDEKVTMEGYIVRCIHLAGTIHEVATIFDSPVDLSLFVEMTPSEQETHHEEYSNDVASGAVVQGPRRLGDVLLIDGYPLDLKLYSTLLDRIGFHSQGFPSGTEAMQVISASEVNVAIVDVCRDPAYGLETIIKLRKEGVKRPVVAISVDDDEETREAALQAGADAFLSKPLDETVIEEQLCKLLHIEVMDASPIDPIVSTYNEDESMRPLLRLFINNAREMIGTLNSMDFATDPDHLYLVCRQLKGAGGGYGFEDVTYSAQSVMDTIGTIEDDVESVQEAVDNLLDVLRRVRVK